MYGDFAGMYDPLMKDVDYDSWAEYLLRFLGAEKLRVTDCACGTGEITLRLARAGHIMTGVDISGDMLRIASEKARGAALKIPFVEQDMRKLALHRSQDAIVCACDGVNYLDSLKAAEEFFEAANAALKVGGLLLFDISSRYKLENILGCNTFAEDEQGGAYIWKNNYDPKSRLIEMNLTFFERQGELYRRFTERHIQRAHGTDELLKALNRAGFDAEAYDFETMDSVKPDSERVQFSGRKRR
ncbi:MAG: class I SAM-dependent methyltransferase [Christensenellales bacterium]